MHLHVSLKYYTIHLRYNVVTGVHKTAIALFPEVQYGESHLIYIIPPQKETLETLPIQYSILFCNYSLHIAYIMHIYLLSAHSTIVIQYCTIYSTNLYELSMKNCCKIVANFLNWWWQRNRVLMEIGSQKKIGLY